MNLKERFTKPTPKFFRTLRNIGIALTAAGGAILAAPVAIPTALFTIATYDGCRNCGHCGESGGCDG